jgi:hypothetical protein
MESADARLVRSGLLILCLTATVFCGKSPAGPSTPLNERFTLAPSETMTIRDANVRIQFIEVTGDSRCPADVVCIQAGDAIVRIRVSDIGDGAAYELHTGDSSRAAVTYSQLRIALVDLQPYPVSSRPIAAGDYRATLIVTR